jgi:putative glutamine transport system substrate-binding protein
MNYLYLSRFALTFAGAGLCLGLLLASASGAEAGTLAAIQQRDRLLVGSKQTFPVFNIKDPSTGRNEGFFADLARALAKQLLGDENKVTFVITTDENRFEKVAHGEKLKVADYSTETFRSGSGLLVKKGSPIKSIDDIKAGTRVAYVKANEDIALLKARVPRAVYLEHESSAEALKTLKEGRADAFTQVVTHLFRAASQDKDYLVTGRFTTKPYHVFLRKGDVAFQVYLDQFIHSLRASGEYDRIYRKWFAPYGDDTVR